MPLYVVNSQMDNLDLDAFVLPYNSSLEKYYTNSYFKKHSLLEFLEKAQKNNISEENVLKKNQVVYYIKNSKDEIPAILTSCKLPEQSKDYQYNGSDEPKDFKERLLKEEKRILSSFYFAEEKIILASFYRKILKTALLNNFYNISIPIIISNIAQSQQYIDLARKTVRNFINNSFDEITVYLQLTDLDNDYFTDKDRKSYKNRVEEQQNLFPLNYCKSNENNDLEDEYDNELVCLNIDQYIKHKWYGHGVYQKDFDFEGHLKKREKREKEKAEWEKLKKSKSSISEYESIDKLISERLKIRDESFSEMVVRKIEEKGLNSVSCYKSANVGRNIFSKITKDANKDENEDGSRYIYRPEKKIALAFAIALHLKQTEAEELLQKAGFSFANSALDIIVKVFIEKGVYDIDLINQQLLKYDLPLLGTTTRDN